MAKKNPLSSTSAGLLGGVIGALAGVGGTYLALRVKPTLALPAGPASFQKGHRYSVTMTSENALPASITSMTAAQTQSAIDSAAATFKIVSLTFPSSTQGVLVFDVVADPSAASSASAGIGGFCVALTDDGASP